MCLCSKFQRIDRGTDDKGYKIHNMIVQWKLRLKLG